MLEIIMFLIVMNCFVDSLIDEGCQDCLFLSQGFCRNAYYLQHTARRIQGWAEPWYICMDNSTNQYSFWKDNHFMQDIDSVTKGQKDIRQNPR